MKVSLWILILSVLLSLFNPPKSTLSVLGIRYTDDKPVLIEFEKGKILKISQSKKTQNDSKIYVAPGLIDLQINGFVGVDFSGPNLTVEKVRKATKALWREGVTSYFPTIITSEFSRIKENLAVLANAMEDPEIGSSILGFHLEGPYISPVDGFRGLIWKNIQESPIGKNYWIFKMPLKIILN